MNHLVLGSYAIEKNSIDYIKNCISIGYEYIDTAQQYNNFEIIGDAIKKLNYPNIKIINKIEAKNWWRDDLFELIKRELDILNIEKYYSILMHWPPIELEKFDIELNFLLKMKDLGLTQKIGLSNCPIYLLERSQQKKITIDQLQVEFHPYINQKKIREYCTLNNINFFGHSLTARGKIFHDSTLNKLSIKYNADVIDIVLNFCKMQNIIPIIASQNIEQAKKNLTFNKIKIDLADYNKIINLNFQNKRYITQEKNNPEWDNVD